MLQAYCSLPRRFCSLCFSDLERWYLQPGASSLNYQLPGHVLSMPQPPGKVLSGTIQLPELSVILFQLPEQVFACKTITFSTFVHNAFSTWTRAIQLAPAEQSYYIQGSDTSQSFTYLYPAKETCNILPV